MAINGRCQMKFNLYLATSSHRSVAWFNSIVVVFVSFSCRVKVKRHYVDTSEIDPVVMCTF